MPNAQLMNDQTRHSELGDLNLNLASMLIVFEMQKRKKKKKKKVRTACRSVLIS